MAVAKAPEGVEATFLEHLLELRQRLIKATLSVLLLFVGLFPFRNTLYALLARPLTAVLPKSGGMIATNPAATFIAPLKLTFAVAAAIAVPVILYQLWAFVAPGLYKKERRLVAPLLISSTVLFYLGMAFAYFFILPLAFHFFAQTAPAGVRVMTDINAYLNFVLRLFFAFGVSFEVPVAIVLLVMMGILKPETLSAKRRYVILAAFVLAAIVTPPDALSQTLLALAMWGLFEVGLLVAYRVHRRAKPEPGPATAAPPVTAADAAQTASAPLTAEVRRPRPPGKRRRRPRPRKPPGP